MKKTISILLTLAVVCGLGLVMAVETAIPVLAAPPHLYEHYDSGDNSLIAVFADRWVAQTFTPSAAHTITSVKLKLYRNGSPGTMHVGIRATNATGQPTGGTLCLGSINGSSLTTDSGGVWYEIDLGGGYPLSASTLYAIVV